MAKSSLPKWRIQSKILEISLDEAFSDVVILVNPRCKLELDTSVVATNTPPMPKLIYLYKTYVKL